MHTVHGAHGSSLPRPWLARSDMEALKQELQVLSERYSQKCLEIGALTRQAEEREHTLRRCQQEGQELLRHNQVDGPAGCGWVRPAWCPHPD